MSYETAFRIEPDQKTNGNNRFAIVVCVFTSLMAISFGYELVVAGGLFVTDDFINKFCVGYGGNTHEQCVGPTDQQPGNWTTFTTLFSVAFFLGNIVGALIGGWFCSKFGRRATIFLSCLVFSLGVILNAVSPIMNHELILAGRVLGGIGLAHAAIALPIYSAECSPKELRGILSAFMQLSANGGSVVGGITMFVFAKYQNAWRFNLIISLAFCVVVMAGVFCCPESPRWTYQKVGEEEAHAILKKLRHTDNVSHELQAIGKQILVEGAARPWGELWTDHSLRRRLIIAILLHVLQQMTGINLIFTYGGQIFRDVSGNGLFSLLILTIVHFVSTIPALYLLDYIGRRALLLFGAMGMTIGHFVFAMSFTYGCRATAESSNCSSTAANVMLVFACFSIFCSAISWGSVPWTYTAEMFPVNVRSRAVSAATMAHWIVGMGMIWFVKLFPALHVNGVFFLFSGFTSLCFIAAYSLCPETKGILLEDVGMVFEKADTGRSRRSSQLSNEVY